MGIISSERAVTDGAGLIQDAANLGYPLRLETSFGGTDYSFLVKDEMELWQRVSEIMRNAYWINVRLKKEE